MDYCETSPKSLIPMQIEAEVRFLWITLLTTRREAPQALEMQGLAWNARKLDKEKFPIKSTACNRYGFCSSERQGGDLVQCRNTTFVHKSRRARSSFQQLVS